MSGEVEKSSEVVAPTSGESAGARSGGLAYEQARLAYTIIQALLEHTRVTQDLVALMAQVIGEETQEALVNTPNWAAYMDSRRILERTREDVEKFAEVWTRLAEELEPPVKS
ncbi:MAG: hypothetical protein QOJ70_287 [Acidobacteriota bacterium]|jgi:hypothetical protein|nr:hypothetical protein [Acidobacteriota bacterium]MDT7806474.1 hypothetical protein [Acidobacteriota bacterium]